MKKITVSDSSLKKGLYEQPHQYSFISVTMPEKSHENLAGQILTPKDLIAYQEGSVVSRMIVYKKSGTITLFAFDTGEGLSEHTAPFDAIASIIDGEAEISIEKTQYLLKEGQMIIMPANKPHALHAQQRFKMMLTMIHE
jgi:quercetin dioxygenase-like cupin family protein